MRREWPLENWVEILERRYVTMVCRARVFIFFERLIEERVDFNEWPVDVI